MVGFHDHHVLLLNPCLCSGSTEMYLVKRISMKSALFFLQLLLKLQRLLIFLSFTVHFVSRDKQYYYLFLSTLTNLAKLLPRGSSTCNVKLL